MARLLQDRYLHDDGDQVWDLATGETIARSAIDGTRPAADLRLIQLAEVLEHGRDGVPRRLDVAAPPGRGTSKHVHTVADEARSRGYIPIGVEIYLRLRWSLDAELCDRALLLIAKPPVTTGAAMQALVTAAVHSPRPHVLLVMNGRPQSGRVSSGFHVHEARATYGATAESLAPAPAPPDITRHLERRQRAVEHVRRGRHAAAERLLRDVIGALVRRQALAAAADTGIMLGRHLLERGRASEADGMFDDAATHAESVQAAALGIAARIWQAAARTDLGQLTAAESLCRAVLLTPSMDAAERARAEATLARVLLWQGRASEAAELTCVRGATASTDDPFVHATAVRVLLQNGQVFEAGQRARALMTVAQAGNDPIAQVIGLTAHLRVLLGAGDLQLAAGVMSDLRSAVRESRAPLRLVRAELLWVDACRRAGREMDAARILRRLERVRRAAPVQLRHAIAQRLRGAHRETPRQESSRVSVAGAATTLVSLIQREDDDRDAVARVLDFLTGALGSSRIDLWSADAGPATSVLAVGTTPPTRLGARVLESGIVIGPEHGDAGREVGVPIRLGSRLVGAVTMRWPSDVVPRADAVDLIQLAGAVAAPRLDAWLASGREEAKTAASIPELVGTSEAMTSIRRAVTRAAASPFNILIDGESGVGKELVARAVHQLSPRRERRFCDVNCAALPDELLESELFGHSRGAYTGALTERPGLVEEAHGGTLFLDEVLDLSPRAQAKLLRVVQQQEVRRVGETFTRPVDVRFVSAANRDVRAEAAAGRFRQDLLYRLEVVRIHVPPLRERPEDVPLLAAHFWRSAASRVGTTAALGHGVVAALTRYHWPGNVRELQNVIAALAVAAPGRGQVRPALLPATITGVTAVTSGRLADARAQFERRFVEVALARAAGSRSQAARELGLSRQGLLKLLARVGLT